MRNLSLDYLKVILAFMVILLHVKLINELSPEVNFIFVNGIFRLAVPIFLIITGYYFSQITNLKKLKKWFIRIFILYVLWMSIYSYFWLDIHNLKLTLITLFTGYFVLWYLIGMIFGGLLLYYSRNLEKKYLFSFAISLYIFGYMIQQLGNMHIFTGNLDRILNWHPISRNFLFNCFPLLAIGYLIKKTQLDEKYTPPLYMVIILIFIIIIESYLNYHFISKTEPLDHLLTLLIVSPLIFIYVKNKKILGHNKYLASFATAIFLIHPLFINIYEYISIDMSKITFVLTASIILSLILVIINNKIKYIL